MGLTEPENPDTFASQPASAATGVPAASPASAHFMYVLSCADGTLYTGYTTDVEARVRAHNAGRGAKYTRSRTPATLVAQARFATKHKAMSAEFRFKQLARSEKEKLIDRFLAGAEPLEDVLARHWGDLS